MAEAQRAAVCTAALWVDLRDCLRAEAAAAASKRSGAPAVTGRWLAVSTRARSDAVVDVPAAEEDVALCGPRLRPPRLGAAFQVTQLPDAWRCVSELTLQ